MKYIIFFYLCLFVFLSCEKTNIINNNYEIKSTNASKELTKDEYNILLKKQTEKPFSGKLLHITNNGEYLCKLCGNPLFNSDAKFDSGTGWPSFDYAIEGAIKYEKDGLRTEITCAKCGGHLGHVFYGEGLTGKNARYCVNSLSLDFKECDNK